MGEGVGEGEEVGWGMDLGRGEELYRCMFFYRSVHDGQDKSDHRFPTKMQRIGWLQ